MEKLINGKVTRGVVLAAIIATGALFAACSTGSGSSDDVAATTNTETPATTPATTPANPATPSTTTDPTTPASPATPASTWSKGRHGNTNAHRYYGIVEKHLSLLG